jgi:hypothetical protein
MENLKARINRCTQIISYLETLPQALTLKSSKNYPENKEVFNRSIYYDDVCDFKLSKNYNMPKSEINNKLSNQKVALGKKPDGSLEDVTISQEIINTVQPFSEICADFNLSNFKDIFDKNQISEDVNRYTSLFSYIDKKKVFGVKKALQDSIRDSTIINQFMKYEKEKISNKLQEAPISIKSNVTMTRTKNKKERIRRNNTNKDIELKLPENINLPLISNFDVQTSPLEDYFAENYDEETYAPSENIYSDDINDFQTPLDILSKKKSDKANEAIKHAVKTPMQTNNEATDSTIKTQQPFNATNQPVTQQVNQPNSQSLVPVQSISSVPNVPVVNNTNIPKPPTGGIPPVPINPVKPVSNIPIPPKLSIKPVPKPPVNPKSPNKETKNEKQDSPKKENSQLPKKEESPRKDPYASTGNWLDEITKIKLKKLGSVKMESPKREANKKTTPDYVYIINIALIIEEPNRSKSQCS